MVEVSHSLVHKYDSAITKAYNRITEMRSKKILTEPDFFRKVA